MLWSRNWKSYPFPPPPAPQSHGSQKKPDDSIIPRRRITVNGFIFWRLSSKLSLVLNRNGQHPPNLPIQWQLQINKMLAESGMVLVYRVEFFCVGNLRRLLMRKEMLVKLRNRKLHVWKTALVQRKRSFKRK